LLGHRRGGPHLLHHDPHDPEQEQVEESEEAELQDGQDGFGHYEASKRITVAPTEISSPSWSTRSRTAVPFTRVPFIDPRSLITKPSALARISACSRDARGSARLTVQSEFRPRVVVCSP